MRKFWNKIFIFGSFYQICNCRSKPICICWNFCQYFVWLSHYWFGDKNFNFEDETHKKWDARLGPKLLACNENVRKKNRAIAPSLIGEQGKKCLFWLSRQKQEANLVVLSNVIFSVCRTEIPQSSNEMQTKKNKIPKTSYLLHFVPRSSK